MNRDRSSDTWAIIAGGGTAGHLLPGLAVANELTDRGHPSSAIHFVGASRGIEATVVPEAGFDITLLPGRGVQRRLTVDNVGALWGLLRALVQSVRLVRRRRPAVVLTLGGFASVACALAAVLWRVPLVVAEQNARAGAANRLVARFATACAVPFADTDLPRSTITGNPVRDQILAARAVERDDACRELDLDPGRTVIVVFAGSLGSRRINEAVYDLVERWSDRSDLAIHHVIGARDYDDRRVIADSALDYRAIRYEQHMDLVLAAADLAVCRSGGTTVAELAVLAVPSILVPLPIATRDHQTANAAELVASGAARLVPDAELNGDRLGRELDAVLGEPGPRRAESLRTMGAAAGALGRPNAAAAVADLIEANAASSGAGPL